MISNDDAVVAGLQSLAKETFSNGAIVEFNNRDYNLLSIAEQIQQDVRTDIMVGPHGAGLMHCVFMPDRGALLELAIDGSGANRHFHNLAHWSGHRYNSPLASNPMNVEALKDAVRAAVNAIDLDSY